MFAPAMAKMGRSFDEYLEDIVQHLSEENYDNVIVTNFEADLDLEPEQLPLADFYPEVRDYTYGWEKEEVKSWNWIEGKDFCRGGTHSEVVLTPHWLRSLQNDIFLCGVFDGECIEDIEYALTGSNKHFIRIEHLIF